MSECEEKLAELKMQRASTKGCITRIKNLVDQKGESLTPPELECRLGILESYFKQVLAYQTSIENLVPNDDSEMKFRGDLEELYCSVKSKLLSLMGGTRKPSIPVETGSQFIVSNSAYSKLPKIRLPQFSGKYSDFSNFFGCFTKLVHKDESLTSLEKFNHLLSCLNGPALRTIKAFEVTEENYSKALNTLKERYDNKYLIFQEHVIDLFNLPRVNKNSAIQLRDLVDSTSAHLSALQSLGSFEDITNALIIYIVNSKLDSDSQQSWEETMDFSKLPSWSQCAKILSKRCQYLESRDAKLHSSESLRSSRQGNKPKFTKPHSTLTSLATTQSACLFCNRSGHVIYKCPEFIRLPVLDRLQEVKKRSLCINCLFKGHSVKRCSVQRCRVCSMPHHTMLHRFSTLPKPQVLDSSDTSKQSEGDKNTPIESNDHSIVGSTSLQTSFRFAKEENNHVFLATAIVKVKDKFGNYHLARVLLDSASQLNFMTENFAQLLQLRRERVETSITGIGDISSKVRYSTQVSIHSRTNEFHTSLQVFILPSITGVQPERKILVNDWKIPNNIELADPRFFEPQKVDLLLGADHFFQLLCVGQIRLGDNLPTLQKTLLGWIVSGRCSNPLRKLDNYGCNLVCDADRLEEASKDPDESLCRIVEKFWEEEGINSKISIWNEEQTQCEEIFVSTFRRLANGRFMVKLPFKNNPAELGNSLEFARNRFYRLEKRLGKHPAIKSQYSDFLQEYLTADHMERISFSKVPDNHYFMPHQCVLRPESSTTKLRVVFDASCRTTSQESLNDFLYVGPTVQDDIFSILLRFRCHKYALVADISAMYRQILVYPEDRNFQLILWRENPQDDLQVFRLKTVTYGTASAPFLATRCLIQLAEENSASFPEASQVIKRDFYMDDLITGANTKEEIYRIREDVEAILGSAQFKLRKWFSNDTKLLLQIPEEDRERPLRINSIDVIKALGMAWEPTKDEFRFHHKLEDSNSLKLTKRTILSDMSKLFDPLGLINPVVVKAKIFLQELWILKLNWDESIPLELQYRWKEYIRNLASLQNLRIPRCVLSINKKDSLEIHGFADASTRAYGCCIYLRSVDESGSVSVNLLTAKSKVAPIRTVRSLPCLELCAALLLSKLLAKVQSSRMKSPDNTFLWTDSEIVLDWLARHPSTWKTFVANRVAEIQTLTTGATWRHVSSKQNPADIISRGANAEELSNSIWFHGPDFLRLPIDSWPTNKDRYNNKTCLEMKKQKSILVCRITDTFLDTVYAFSNFIKNCRRFALVLRFIKNLRNIRNKVQVITGPLSAAEIDDAFLRHSTKRIWRGHSNSGGEVGVESPKQHQQT